MLQVHQNGHQINARPESISIGGISAGGQIGAVLQQLARDSGIDLKLGMRPLPNTLEARCTKNTPSNTCRSCYFLASRYGQGFRLSLSILCRERVCALPGLEAHGLFQIPIWTKERRGASRD